MILVLQIFDCLCDRKISTQETGDNQCCHIRSSIYDSLIFILQVLIVYVIGKHRYNGRFTINVVTLDQV